VRRSAVLPAEQEAVILVVRAKLGALSVELVDQDAERSQCDRIEGYHALARIGDDVVPGPQVGC